MQNEPKVIELSSDDVAKLQALDQNANTLLLELGALREEFVMRETAIMNQLNELRNERASLVSAYGRHYLSKDPGQWRFNTDVMAFVSDVQLIQENTNDHGNTN